MQKIYVVDAFTSHLFGGNPAAVCPLNSWIADDLMQQIAAENNLSETAFYVKENKGYHIRWFTPTEEVDLCGHATLACAHILYHKEGHVEDVIELNSRSGTLMVRRRADRYVMNFPSDVFEPIPHSEELKGLFQIEPIEIYRGKTDFLFIYQTEEEIASLIPNLSQIKKIGGRGLIASATSEEVDFVSRFFAPQAGVDEDAVTGSAHTTLTPYWSQKLGKTELSAKQISSRQGVLECTFQGERVEIAGTCKLYLEGFIYV